MRYCPPKYCPSNFFGTIAVGASGLSRIGTLVEGHPHGFYVTGLYCTLAHPFGLKKNKNPLPEQDAGDEANTNVFVRTTIGPSNRDEVYSICIALELPICRRISARN